MNKERILALIHDFTINNVEACEEQDVDKSFFTAGLVAAYMEMLGAMGINEDFYECKIENGCLQIDWLFIDGKTIMLNGHFDKARFEEITAA